MAGEKCGNRLCGACYPNEPARRSNFMQQLAGGAQDIAAHFLTGPAVAGDYSAEMASWAAMCMIVNEAAIQALATGNDRELGELRAIVSHWALTHLPANTFKGIIKAHHEALDLIATRATAANLKCEEAGKQAAVNSAAEKFREYVEKIGAATLRPNQPAKAEEKAPEGEPGRVPLDPDAEPSPERPDDHDEASEGGGGEGPGADEKISPKDFPF